MKVIFLHRLWPIYGGGETVTISLANEMVRNGIEVHIAYFHESDINLKKPFIDERIYTHQIEGVHFNEYSNDLFVNPKEAKYVNKKITDIILSANIDILHNQWWPVDFFKEAKKKTNVKVITVLHMQVDVRKAIHPIGLKKFLFRIIEPFYRYIEKQKNLYRSDKYYKYSDKYVFLVEDFMDYYRKEKGLSCNDNKTTYIYNPSTYYTCSDEEQLKQKSKEILFVGRLVENHKQVFRLLQAWDIVSKEINDWHLTIIGEGPDKQQYLDYIQSNKINNITFEGFQQPLPFYKRASIFCMTSAYEGFGMTLIEAMQNGCVPIVMNTFAACKVIIENGYNGILIEDNDIVGFAEAIKKLITNSKFRIQLKQNGFSSCQKFHVTNIANQWIELYKTLLTT